MKKLVFVSNFMNHHQKALAENFADMYGDDYVFIATTPFPQDRGEIGYRDMNQEPFVFRAYESPAAMTEAQRMIDEAECVVVGGTVGNSISSVLGRLAENKLTFLYAERFWKGPLWKDAVRLVKYLVFKGGRRYARSRESKFYLLCASAFAAWDYSMCGLFRGKAYRWGYFPETVREDRQIPRIEAPRINEDKAASCGQADSSNGSAKNLSKKRQGSILWAGRFLEWKHPELAVLVARNLREMGLDFTMKMVGSGEVHDKTARMVADLGLGDKIELPGAFPADKMREEMDASQIFLFTSDRGEGWGAVLNESMSSGCAVVAGEKIGSVPFLIKDGVNGLIFRDRDADDLTAKVAGLLRDPGRIETLGQNARETLVNVWSPQEAARRFVRLAEELDKSTGPVSLWEDGPCSVAPVI